MIDSDDTSDDSDFDEGHLDGDLDGDDLDGEAQPASEADGPDSEADSQPAAKRGVRQRLSEAEDAVGHLTDLLRRQREELLNQTALEVGINPWLARQSGVNAADHLSSDGLVDLDALRSKLEATRSGLGIPPPSRRPQPNPLAGMAGSSGGEPVSFADVMRDHMRRN